MKRTRQTAEQIIRKLKTADLPALAAPVRRTAGRGARQAHPVALGQENPINWKVPLETLEPFRPVGGMLMVGVAWTRISTPARWPACPARAGAVGHPDHTDPPTG